MTKFILHGGIRHGSQQLLSEMSFFSEFIKDLPKHARVLCVYAAIDSDRWEDEFKREQEKISALMGLNAVELELGSNDAQELAEQIVRSDAVYFRGGYSSELIKSTLMKVSNLRELLKNKIVAGSSAGAYALSKYYISVKGVLGKGLDIVSCKVMAHYTDERIAELEALKKYGEDLPLYALKEGEYVIIEQ